MAPELSQSLKKATAQLEAAANAKKCWPCGCLHDTLAAIERSLGNDPAAEELMSAAVKASARLEERDYDCLGCDTCYPANAVNFLNKMDGERMANLGACPSDKVEERSGWPPLPGSYRALRYQASVAICTLTDDQLGEKLVQEAGTQVSLIGTLQTENLGIERLIKNALANPNVRFLIVCGPDSRQAVGHLPGQSLVALSQNGLDRRMRIIGSKGKRPILRNVSREAVERFRSVIQIVDLVGETDITQILKSAQERADRHSDPAAPFDDFQSIPSIKGYLPKQMTADPMGYFVVYVDRRKRQIALEHYQNNDVLDVLIEGRAAAEFYAPMIERGLVSRLDHAAYLGRELTRAEWALKSGEAYVQDRAPEEQLSKNSGVSCRSC